MNTKNTMLFVVRRNSLLFMDRSTGMRYDAPIPGEQRPNIPAYLRLGNGGPKSGEAFLNLGWEKFFNYRKKIWYGLRKVPWLMVFPDDVQAAEEALLINYAIGALGAKRCFCATFSDVIGPGREKGLEYVSVTDTFRSCAVAYYDGIGERPRQRFYPLESFHKDTLNAALAELCPGRQPPVYVDDMEGTGRWNHLGIPVSLDQAIETVWNGLERIKI